MFNKRKFKAKMAELGLTIEKISNEIGINQATLHRKINGASDFTRTEIKILRNALKLTVSEAEEIFFADWLA